MDALGQRVIRDTQEIQYLRERADKLEREANRLRAEADEVERLLDLARLQH